MKTSANKKKEYAMREIKESNFFKGPIVSMQKSWDDEWELVDTNTRDILFKGSKSAILEQYDIMNDVKEL